jgi:type I restriction enzyme S subunit
VRNLPPAWQSDRLKDIAQINSHTLPAGTDPDYEFDYLEISNVNYYGIIDLHAIERLRYEDVPSRARRRVVTGNTVISSTMRPICMSVTMIPPSRGVEALAEIRRRRTGEPKS